MQQKSDGKDKRSEHFGPIALTRHVKDDGRALILYTLREPSEEAGDPGGHSYPGGHSDTRDPGGHGERRHE